MKFQFLKLPVLSNNFIADLWEICVRMVCPAHTLYRKNCTHHSSAWIGTAFEWATEIRTQRIFCTCKMLTLAAPAKAGIWAWTEKLTYTRENPATFANTDVNQEYAFDSRWYYTARAGNQGQNRDLECCQAEAILHWYLFWNPIETIISQFIKPQLQMLK